MALGAVLAAALTDHSARSRSLTVQGLDVLKQPGGGYGVPIETISVEEAAPGYVSSMSFTIEDPAKAVTVNTGDKVQFWDHVRDIPIFAGFVDTAVYSPAFATGRTITVECVGLDAVLDWLTLPAVTLAFTWAGGYDVYPAVQSLYAQANGIGVPLNTGFAVQYGSQAFPVGNLTAYQALMASGTYAITGGTSLRSAIRGLLAAAVEAVTYLSGQPSYGLTVDFYGGLRCWDTAPAFYTTHPSDYADLTVTDTSASALTSAQLLHVMDGGSVVRGVQVNGGNAAGTGYVSDGSGIPGRTSVVTDATLLTAAAKLAAANDAIAQAVVTPRGSFLLDTYTPTSVHPGSTLTLTDAGIGVATWYRVQGITKTFNGDGTQQWTVAYGNPAPSYVDS